MDKQIPMHLHELHRAISTFLRGQQVAGFIVAPWAAEAIADELAMLAFFAGARECNTAVRTEAVKLTVQAIDAGWSERLQRAVAS